jgi:hypothetical protein
VSLSGHCIRLECASAELSPIENTTSTFPAFIPPRGASRWRAAPRWRESLAPANRAGAAPLPNARSRRHSWISVIAPSAVALDGTFGVTPLFAESLRAARHLVRRMAMRWVVVAPRGVPARGGCGGGLVGSQEDCALLASWPGPLWRPEAAMRLLWRDWRQALPASGTAWVVRRVLRASCVYGVVAERRFTFANTWFLLGATGAECSRRRGPRRRLHTRRHLCSGPRPLNKRVNEIADIRWE